MFASLLPKSAPFFEMLLEQNRILCGMSALLSRMFEDGANKDALHKEISLLEEEADKLHVRIVRALSQTFITPIDREDILRINQAQEDLMDCMQSLSTRLHIFEFSRVRFPALRLVRTICRLLELSRLMLDGLTRREDCHKTRAFHDLRGECDMILAAGLAELMDEDTSSPQSLLLLFKWSQIYDRIEIMLGAVNNLAETLEEAVLKNV